MAPFTPAQDLPRYTLATGRQLPSSNDVACCLNLREDWAECPELAEPLIEQLQEAHWVASNQNARARWASLYRDALEHLGARPSRR